MKSMKQRAVLAGLVFGAIAAAGAAELSPVEQQIVAEVKAHNAQGLQLLERSVNINSGTLNHAGVREVGKLFGAEFEQLGFKTRWIDMPPAMNRAGHLEASREGKQGKRVLLIGHLDTVFEKDSPVQLWDRKGDRVRGQGVADMKGGDVIIIEALRALQKVGALDNTSITVMFGGDEENAGDPIIISRADMIAAAKRSDVALAFEGVVRNKQGVETGTIGRRASSSWELVVKGKQGHTSGIFTPEAGYGAIFEAARIVDAFRRELPEADLTYSPGLILGGTEATLDAGGARGTAYGKNNIIANTTIVKGDLRYLSQEQGDRVHAKMQAIVAQHLPGASAVVSFHESYPPMSPTAGNLKLLDTYSKASDDAGLGKVPALPPGERGAGDVQFAAPYVDSLDGLGAGGRGSHSPDEELDIPTIERSTIRAALLIYRLTR